MGLKTGDLDLDFKVLFGHFEYYPSTLNLELFIDHLNVSDPFDPV